MTDAPPAGITAESKVNDVLARHPATAPVFTQGRLYVDQPRNLYATFPGLTVGDFARQNDLELDAVLVQLNALAESQDAAQPRDGRAAEDAARLGHFSLTLGYTASYRPREDAAPDRVSVVSVQSAHGPE